MGKFMVHLASGNQLITILLLVKLDGVPYIGIQTQLVVKQLFIVLTKPEALCLQLFLVILLDMVLQV